MTLTTIELSNQLIDLDKNDPAYSQKRIKLMVQFLTRYMETYDKQYNYEGYSDETFIEDILYGLGVALNPQEHRFADGFDRWKEKLIEYLTEDKDDT